MNTHRHTFFGSLFIACVLFMSRAASAQLGGGAGGGFGGGLGGGFGGNSGGLGGVGGIVIDADGIVQLRQVRSLPPATLKKQITRFAQEKLPAGVVVETAERTLSLKNLETLISGYLEKKADLPIEVRCLAGLQRIDAIAFDPDARDVYLIGPADAFGPDNQGRMVGAMTGRPTLLLEDLLTVLRAHPAREESIGCSIDPTPENMKSLQDYLKQNSTPAHPAQVKQRFRNMATVLGNQQISVWGVPEQSHFALALVEADVRMKRIALGLDAAGVPGLRSHLSLLKPQGNSLQRWWFVPMYEPLETNQERTLFMLRGQRAKLLSQEEISDSNGQRTNAAFTRQSTEKFAQLFTEHFQELADHSAPFAELQNLYDLAVVAALIRQEGRKHLGENPFPLLLSAERLPLPQYAVPKLIPSASSFRSAGVGTILGLVGGVTMDITPVLRTPQIVEGLQLENYRAAVNQQSLFGDTAQ